MSFAFSIPAICANFVNAMISPSNIAKIVSPFFVSSTSICANALIDRASCLIAAANIIIAIADFMMLLSAPNLLSAIAAPVRPAIRAIMTANAGQVVSQVWNTANSAIALARIKNAAEIRIITPAAIATFFASSVPNLNFSLSIIFRVIITSASITDIAIKLDLRFSGLIRDNISNDAARIPTAIAIDTNVLALSVF